MSILLHGAINGSNFGDCLFAHIFYHVIREHYPDEDVFFYDINPFGISKHLRNYLNYTIKLKRSDYKKTECLVYISGGYFGEGKKSFLSSVIRVLRYYQLGLHYILRKKPVYIIGMEVGPFFSKYAEMIATRILQRASIVTVRNQESKEYCDKHGISSIKTADTAIGIKEYLDIDANALDGIVVKNQKKDKYIFLHITISEQFDDYFIKYIIMPIIRFMKRNIQYGLIYGCDGIPHTINHCEIETLFNKENLSFGYYEYDNPTSLCNVINCCDIIITRKLHVGVIGCALGKSVISTPTHEYKTRRFYEQINALERCVPYNKIKQDDILALLEKYHDKPIMISNNLVQKSKRNIELLLEQMDLDKAWRGLKQNS